MDGQERARERERLGDIMIKNRRAHLISDSSVCLNGKVDC
jgi:hypothetical protein